MITAKIKLQSKTNEVGEGDAEWARWTPGLSLTMGVRGAVADRFEVGKPYTLQFVEE